MCPLRRLRGGSSSDGRKAHIIRAGDRSEWLAVGAAAESFALLVGGELRAAVESDAARFRAGAFLAGAGADQLVLERGQAPEDGEQQTAVWGSWCRPRHLPAR